ncbi:hypothetical protein [Halovivax limisalsi]|uniref:hypothetical protein n=1 Tax=Halovivax limisalsi TaxID=1453760 RepID=UPI001FFCC15F|nr:hypothetical protein [Halovivax limisalsi]
MATVPATDDSTESTVESYGFGIAIVERDTDAETDRYRFVAPDHAEITFESLDDVRLYADVYFDVNGFVEAGTGDRGVPPEIVQAGKDTMAAYLVSAPWADTNWVASFYGTTPAEIERYCDWVRRRADSIRASADEAANE